MLSRWAHFSFAEVTINALNIVGVSYGRLGSRPIQTESYFLACCRYVELNPVRARMVADPGSYRWSSYSERSAEVAPSWIGDHPCYMALGGTQQERWEHYKYFVLGEIPDGEYDLIRRSLQRGKLTVNQAFIDEVEHMIGRRIKHRGPGNQHAKKRLE